MSRIIPVRAVFEDGTVPDEGEPLKITAFNLSLPQWTDAQLDIESVGSNGAAFDITGGAFIFTARTRNEAVPAIISHEGDIVDGPAGSATLDIGSVDTGIAVQNLPWNLAFVDAAGKVWATTAQGTCAIVPSQYVPGQTVTVPESQQPLAQGPAGQGFTERGAYSAGTTYAPYDVISYELDDATSTYVCILASTGNLPTDDTYWTLWASGAAAGSGLPDPATFNDGCVPVVRSGAWVYDTRLTQDDIDAGFSISSFAGAGTYAATKEVGDSIINPSFTASYSALPASATINDGDGALALSSPFTAFAYSGGNAKTYTKTVVAAFVTWLLSAIQSVTDTASVTATWLPRVFYGVAVPGTLNEAFIEALASSALGSGFARTIVYPDAGGTKKLYYAFPASFGTPSTFTSGGFSVPFSLVATVTVTNSFGVALSYSLWASDNILNAAFTVVIS